ncbi:MAG: XRE family transcriptional regulator [Myxococcales bacterium]|nr:XRE family transcriptional regulator [Myxococcales bacterium]USN51938.1 MAG: XRE family transcriptional regulator [Myxococcales bacterium]
MPSVKKKLQQAGFAVGDAKDFLELNEEEAAYLEVKVALTEALIRNRAKAGVSQAELAKMMHSSQSRVAKMEAGDSSVSVDLLIRALVYLGFGVKDVGRALTRPMKRAA